MHDPDYTVVSYIWHKINTNNQRKIDKINCLKIKMFVQQNMISESEKTTCIWEKIFPNHISDKTYL